jgi:hypothetical protein
MAATTAAIVAAVAATTGAVVQGVSNYQAGKVQEAQNNFNAQQEEQARKQAFQEESLNSSQHYRAVRHEMASGLNEMLGMGNVGTSTESAIRGGHFNLAEDLSALRYRYGAEAANHETGALNYRYNAGIAKRNRKVGVLASSLNTVSAAANGVLGYYNAGGFSGSPKVKNTYKGAVTNNGMYGAWAG